MFRDPLFSPAAGRGPLPPDRNRQPGTSASKGRSLLPPPALSGASSGGRWTTRSHGGLFRPRAAGHEQDGGHSGRRRRQAARDDTGTARRQQPIRTPKRKTRRCRGAVRPSRSAQAHRPDSRLYVSDHEPGNGPGSLWHAAILAGGRNSSGRRLEPVSAVFATTGCAAVACDGVAQREVHQRLQRRD